MSGGGFVSRGPAPSSSYASGYSGGQSRLDEPEVATPEQRDADAGQKESIQAAQLLAEVKRLAEVDPQEWTKRRDDLSRRVEAFASTRTTPALASAAGDRARALAAEAIAEARKLLAAAKAPQAVPTVTGEAEIAPRVLDKSAATDDVIAWMTRLSLSERKAVVQRYEAVSGGSHKNSPDRFAVALANYLAEHRGLAKRLHQLATRSQKQVAMERAQQAELDAEAAVETDAPASVAGDVTMVAPRYADSATSKYLGEHWQEVRAQVVAVFAAKAHGWLDPQLAWGLDANALATHAIEGLLPTMYMPGTLESLVDSVDELVEGARAVGRQPGGRDDAWNPAVGRAIGRDLEEQVGRAVRTMSANYARMSANRRGASPRDLLKPATRFERIAVALLEQGHVHASGRSAAKPTPASTPTPAEREAVLGPAVEGRVAPGSELTLEPASPIPVDVDAHDAQRSTLRNASAAADYAEAGGPGGALAVDTARERFEGLDDSDPTSADLDARIDTFLLHLGALSQNLHKTSDALFGSGETIAHVAGLYWVARAEELAHRALAVDHTIATVRARLRGQLEGVTDRAQRQRLLASAQTEIAAKLSQTQLVELSEKATTMLRDVEQAANVIFTINSMVISIALSLVAAEVGAVIASSLLSALARTTMVAAAEGAVVVAGEAGAAMVAAEGAGVVAGQVGARVLAAKTTAFLAGQITEAAINAAFQAALFGDDSGEAFAENLLASLLAQVGTRGMGKLNEAAVRAGEAGMGRAGRAGLELATGAGAGVAAQGMVRGDGGAEADPVLMGISVTFGHWLGRRIAKAKERVATRGGNDALALQAELDDLARRAERLLDSGVVERAEVIQVVAAAHDVLRAVEGNTTAAGGASVGAAKPHDAAPASGADATRRPKQTTAPSAGETPPQARPADPMAAAESEAAAHAVPGSFHGGARPDPEPARVEELATAAAAKVVVRIGGNPLSRDTVALTDGHGGHRTVRILVESAQANGAVAWYDPAQISGGGEIVLRVSDRAADHHIERAIAHDLAEIRHRLRFGAAVAGPDALAPGATATSLSAHDVGRLAELNVMVEQLRAADKAAASGDPGAVEHKAQLLREGRELVEHLGLTGDGSNRRMALASQYAKSPDARAVVPKHMSDTVRELTRTEKAKHAPSPPRQVADDVKHLKKATGIAYAELEKLVAARREGHMIASEVRAMDDAIAIGAKGMNLDGTGVERLRRVVEALAQPTAASIQENLTFAKSAGMPDDNSAVLTEGSLIADTNVVIATRWTEADLNALPTESRRAEESRRRAVSGESDLRASDVTHAIELKPPPAGVVDGTRLPERFALTVSRDAPEYAELLSVLIRYNLGTGTGLADRSIVADAFFARTDGAVPRFMTDDDHMINPLLAMSGRDPATVRGVPPRPLGVVFPHGFEVEIHGRRLIVIPVEGR